MTSSADTAQPSPVYWASAVLAALTFPLIWVGGLVTSTDAGMAVPDWPSTYGSNMFLYPWQTWFFGPWDLFVEHGHRLLGSLVGLVAIAVVIAAWLTDSRNWVRWGSVGLLLLVIAQGALGGMRVLLDERVLARLHGCVGPLFFTLAIAFVTLTNPKFAGRHAGDGSPTRFGYSLATLFAAYVQLVIGAHLRHLSWDTSPQVFRATVIFHLLVAALVTWLAIGVWRFDHRGGVLLLALVGLQLVLGLGSWVARYAWPSFLSDFQFAAQSTVVARSWTGALIRTSHTANGSAILGAACCATLCSYRSGYLASMLRGNLSGRSTAGVIA